MKILQKFYTLFKDQKVDQDILDAYRSAIPSKVDFKVRPSGDRLVAIIKKIDNYELPKEVLLITEAESKDALIDMINDLIFSYKDIPEQYRKHYKRALTPDHEIIINKNTRLVKA